MSEKRTSGCFPGRLLLALALVCVSGSAVPAPAGEPEDLLVYGQTLTYWFNALRGEDPTLSERAAVVLESVGPEDGANVPELRALLESKDPYLRERAIEILVRIGGPAVPSLAAALTHREKRVKLAAAEALKGIGSDAGPAVNALSAVLRDKDPDLRRAAAQALGDIPSARDTSAVAALRGAMEDQDRTVRMSALWAYKRVGRRDEAALKVLMNLTKDDDPSLRAESLHQLISFDWDSAREAIPVFIEALKEADPSIREKALKGLLRYPAEAAAAVPTLLENLKFQDPHSERPRLKSEMRAWAIRLKAARLLGEIKDSAAVPGLIAALGDEKADVRREAIQALGKINDDRAVDPLIELLRKEKGHFRAKVVEALGNLGDERAVPPLLEALKSAKGESQSYHFQEAFRRLQEHSGPLDPAEEHARWRGCVTVSCHQDVLDGPQVHLPVRYDPCTSCHGGEKDGHPEREGKEFSVPSGGEREFCVPCHRLFAEKSLEAKYLHGPIEEGKCLACHRAHTSEHRKLLRKNFAAEYYLEFDLDNYALCWECHDSGVFLVEKTTELTRFRNGDWNLHCIHVNQEKGRSCKACHDMHGDSDQMLIGSHTHYWGGWKLPVEFTETANGGNCVVGCHREMNYDRDIPVRY